MRMGGRTHFLCIRTGAHSVCSTSKSSVGEYCHRSKPDNSALDRSRGVLFAMTCVIDWRMVEGATHPFAARNVLISWMILPHRALRRQRRRTALRWRVGVHDEPAEHGVRRAEFDRLHAWSTRVEGTGLVLGLTLLYVTSR